MPFGAAVLPSGGVRFGLWAPTERRVSLCVEGVGRWDVPANEDGWRQIEIEQARAGQRYQWVVDVDGRETAVPDPASRSNPDGVHAASAIVDPAAYKWQTAWRGRPWHEAVIYEMHVGAFTRAGTFAAAQEHLERLAQVGITCIELMPLSSFPGRFGWGYDGVLHFAPHAAYGSPDELKRFIDAAHALNLMVMIDVVYNHFGPDGNYLPLLAPPFFHATHSTAWGAAIDFDGARSTAVRDFFVHNALYWIEEFQFDGLRLDAVHAIVDTSQPDILQEIAARVRDLAAGERHVHLVLENEHNQAERLRGPSEVGAFDAQWNDDFHHAIHVLTTGERDGYYQPYGERPIDHLARTLTLGFSRVGQNKATACEALPLDGMVDFIHNHDHVGNRAFGERLSALIPAPTMRLLTAMLLLAPSIPMLFMGDECGAQTPFLYFADWSGELREAVCRGRRAEFAHFPAFADSTTRDRIPDPCDAASFERSTLDWPALQGDAHGAVQEQVTQLLALRRREIWPRAQSLQVGEHRAQMLSERALRVQWCFDNVTLEMAVNLSDGPADGVFVASEAERELHRVGEIGAHRLGPWSGYWRCTPRERQPQAAALGQIAAADDALAEAPVP